MTSLNPTPLGKPHSGHNTANEKVAVVGVGHWGKNLVRNFHKLDFLHTVCDLNTEALSRVHQEYPDIQVTPEFQQILADSDITGVIISTPTATHFDLAIQALEAGKHVYVEKPVATSAAQAEQLFTLAQDSNLTLMVGHLLLYHPVVNRLKQLIAEGYLGEIKYIQSDRLNFNQNRQDKSVIWDLAPHDISMMMYVLDMEPERIVNASGHRTSEDGRVDVAHIELEFPGGVTGHIHNSWVNPNKQAKLVVRGTKRIAELNDSLTEGKLQIFDRDDENKLVQEFPEYLTIEPLKLECQHFINAIREGRSPKTDGINGYHVVKILEQADRLLEQAE
ncbi:MAG: Gfo/Idh/MocA family oxidoreductase [Vampirovibrio sp.]|nr:Gfo/Idh/MocA family oxidoreductase [Vampirovibrio sp.]